MNFPICLYLTFEHILSLCTFLRLFCTFFQYVRLLHTDHWVQRLYSHLSNKRTYGISVEAGAFLKINKRRGEENYLISVEQMKLFM